MAEAEYISKEASIACFSDWIDRYGHEHSADEMAEYKRIEDLLPADVVKVVRCKDCKEFQANHHWCGFLKIDIDPDEYCSYGERRADNV